MPSSSVAKSGFTFSISFSKNLQKAIDGLKRCRRVWEGVPLYGGSMSQKGSLYSFSTRYIVSFLFFRGVISRVFNFFSSMVHVTNTVYT